MLRFNIERGGYACRVVLAGDAALGAVRDWRPDLIVLDRMLPGLSGDEVLTGLSRDPTTAAIPVIMLTAKTEEADQLVGFALGAADYVPKPFSMKLLLARIEAVLRRSAASSSAEDAGRMSGGPIELDPARHELTVDGAPAAVTATEFRILETLMRARGRVLSRAQLLQGAFGEDVVVTDRTVDVHITSLRKKLGAAAVWVQTVRGVGYTFREPRDD